VALHDTSPDFASKYDRPTWGEQLPTTSGLDPGVGLTYIHCNSRNALTTLGANRYRVS